MLKKMILTVLCLGMSPSLFGADKITILSPHRRSIQQEFIPIFKTFYKKTYNTEVEVSWLDQGGTSDDVRFLKAKFAKNPKTSGVDVFWGGGATTFVDLSEEKILAKYTLSDALKKEIPTFAAGISLHDSTETWYASALSSFGIFYNKRLLVLDKLPEPKLWSDLAKKEFFGNLSLADPRRSGSATTMNNIIIQSMAWEKGWELLTSIAGNTKKFTHSSSDPIKAVVSGDVACAMAIDFYANAKIGNLGSKNLGFSLPAAQTVIDPDPVAILKGAPNRKTAERFLEFVLSAQAQKLLILPKGTKGGPRLASLGRMAVNRRAYSETVGLRTNAANPFEMKESLKIDTKKSSKMHRILGDLIGAMHIDTHKQLKKAWKAILKRGQKPEEVAAFGKMPVSEDEVLKLAEKWDDNVMRNKVINEWLKFAQEKYSRLEAGKI